MSPEVLFDSLAIATRAETRKNPEQYRALKTSWGQKLTQNFGDDEGNEVSFNGTVVQALLMMNGREINGEIGSGAMRAQGSGRTWWRRWSRSTAASPRRSTTNCS